MAGMEELLYDAVLARFTWKGSRFLTCGLSEVAGLVGKSFFKVGCWMHFFPKSKALFSLLEKRVFSLQMLKALL